MRDYLIAVLGIFLLTAFPAAAYIPINDTQQSDIESSFYRLINQGGISSMEVDFGSDIVGTMIMVTFIPDVYGGSMTSDEAEETIADVVAKISGVHMDILKKYPDLENVGIQIRYDKLGLGAIVSGRAPMGGCEPLCDPVPMPAFSVNYTAPQDVIVDRVSHSPPP
jgi:hypothetical protein